jgi:hypothetical protein
MLTAIKRLLARWWFRFKQEEPPAPPRDPYAYRTAPRKRGPYERGGAVAVLEPGEDNDSIDMSQKAEKYS